MTEQIEQIETYDAAFGLQVASWMAPEPLSKLEQFLVAGIQRARAAGYTIVAGAYHPYDKSCCPIYASCKEARDKISDTQPPCYEDVIAEAIGKTFTVTHLHSFLDGFDCDKPFMHYTFLTPHRDENVFNLGRKLRNIYVATPPQLPSYIENAQDVSCMSEQEIAHFVETMELPNVMFGHINWCHPCRKRLEQACGCITRNDVLNFFQSKEIKAMALRHVQSCIACLDLLNQVSNEEPLPSQPTLEVGVPRERAILLYRPPVGSMVGTSYKVERKKEIFLFTVIINAWQQVKNWLNRWLWI